MTSVWSACWANADADAEEEEEEEDANADEDEEEAEGAPLAVLMTVLYRLPAMAVPPVLLFI